MAEGLDLEIDGLDRWMNEVLEPSPATIDRVRRRLPFAESRRWRPAVPWLAAAAVLLLVGGAAWLGMRLGAPSDRFATTVLPPSGQTAPASGSAYQDFGPALGQGAAPTAAAAPLTSVYTGSCSLAPSVQLQGRGVTATGFAPLAATEAGPALVNLSVQANGGSASAVSNDASTKAAAVEAALKKAGLGDADVQRTGFYLYSGPNNQAFANVTIAAHVPARIDPSAVISAAIAAGANSASSAGQVPGTDASASEVSSAVTAATAEAKNMASSIAGAAGVQINQLQTVVAQPPQVCYGPGGPQRVVAVTVSYSLK